ncbi:MAG: type II toxin-antitoxin system RelE/ParE family toxin [Limisphaerales bacterium]
MPGLVFHRLVARDLQSVLSHYTKEGAPQVAEQFRREFERVVTKIAREPGRFHTISGTRLRRANFRRFPYHLLFHPKDGTARVLILRHHRRHPDYGLDRE